MDYYISRQLESYIFLFKGQEGKIFLMLNELPSTAGQAIRDSHCFCSSCLLLNGPILP